MLLGVGKYCEVCYMHVVGDVRGEKAETSNQDERSPVLFHILCETLILVVR